MHVQVSLCDAFIITRVSRLIPVRPRPSSLIFTSHPAARVASICLDAFVGRSGGSGRFVPSLRRPRRPPFSSFNHPNWLTIGMPSFIPIQQWKVHHK